MLKQQRQKKKPQKNLLWQLSVAKFSLCGSSPEMNVQNRRRLLCLWRLWRKELLLGDAPAEPRLPPTDTPGLRIPDGCVCWGQGAGRSERRRRRRLHFPWCFFNCPRLEIRQVLRHCTWLWWGGSSSITPSSEAACRYCKAVPKFVCCVGSENLIKRWHQV